ncbi:MAG: helix-turn-helix transcriptional regulator [Ectothiorhodospiraceae bacterium]|nr:helix-turn-helix transcriptional regulator [Ectothiorhodospiraceae bacterium]
MTENKSIESKQNTGQTDQKKAVSSIYTLGERIKIVRKAQNPSMSQIEFANDMGVGISTLQRYERSERSPDAAFLNELCRQFQVNGDWLLNGNGYRQSSKHAFLIANLQDGTGAYPGGKLTEHTLAAIIDGLENAHIQMSPEMLFLVMEAAKNVLGKGSPLEEGTDLMLMTNAFICAMAKAPESMSLLTKEDVEAIMMLIVKLNN